MLKFTMPEKLSKKYRLCCCCSVTKSSPSLCNFMHGSTQDSCVLHYLPWSLLTFLSPELVTLSSHLTLSPPPSPFAFNLSQHQGLFQWAMEYVYLTKLFSGKGKKTNQISDTFSQFWIMLMTCWQPLCFAIFSWQASANILFVHYGN